MIKWIKKKIKDRRWKKTISQSIARYRVEFKGVRGCIYVDTQDKEDIYEMFHNYLGDPEVKIIAEMLDGASREVKLGRRIENDHI